MGLILVILAKYLKLNYYDLTRFHAILNGALNACFWPQGTRQVCNIGAGCGLVVGTFTKPPPGIQ